MNIIINHTLIIKKRLFIKIYGKLSRKTEADDTHGRLGWPQLKIISLLRELLSFFYCNYCEGRFL